MSLKLMSLNLTSSKLPLWPTRFGWAFLGLVLLTLIGCINYALSLGYGLTFLLSGVWIVTAAQARRAARTLSLSVQAPVEAVAGHEMAFSAQVRQAGAASPVTLRAWAEQNGRRVPLTASLSLGAGDTQTAALKVPDPVRGPLRLSDVRLVAHDAFGLWQAAVPVQVEAEVAVTPRAGSRRPRASHAGGQRPRRERAAHRWAGGFRRVAALRGGRRAPADFLATRGAQRSTRDPRIRRAAGAGLGPELDGDSRQS